MIATTVQFYSFGRIESGRVISHDGDFLVVQTRNPYGSHNLVAVEWIDGEWVAFRHGTAATLIAASKESTRLYRRVRKFLAQRGIGRDWVLRVGGENA